MSLPTNKMRRAGRKGWYARWYDDRTKKLVWKKLHENAALADRALRKLQEDLLRPESQRGRFVPMTLKEFFDKHYKKDFLSSTAKRWATDQTKYLEHHILPTFGHLNISRITLYEVERWYTKLLATHKIKSCNLYATTFKTMLKRAVQGRFIEKSPLQDLRLQRPEKRIPAHLTRAEIKSMYEGLSGFQRALFTLWICTGLRASEMLWLQWGDIDLENKRVFVRGKEGHPIKDNEDRCIPLVQDLVDELIPLSKGKQKEDFFYPLRDGKRVRNFWRSLRWLFEKAKVRQEDGNALLLRHTFASLFLSGGGSIAELKQYMGHCSITITERHYAAFIPPEASSIHKVNFSLK